MSKRLSKSLYSQRWESLLKILKRTRKEKGLTQIDVAKKLGRPQSLIAKIESGERRLDLCQFLDYVEVIGADPLEMIRELLAKPELPGR